MHPAQLSLLPDQVPVPAPMVLAELSAKDVGEAISLLGALIAKASASAPAATTTPEVEVGGDE
ncbi:MAG: hypothetical protein ACYDAD_12665 [Acidimicrobiales bacterium]